ncbi:BrnA antitoxin family protein [Variovorax paradoxus]|uniref:BrnA antitoxin family protein n=1 Tax=Variovorax paradoxus TaxID=34073 RepID=UPI003D6484DB
MTQKPRIASTVEAWESGALGLDAKHARKVSEETARQIDEALGMQPISIRLPKSTIDTYKMLAKLNGVGYQPLMRDAICRWAESELKQLLIGAVETQRQQAAEPEPPHHPEPMRKAA